MITLPQEPHAGDRISAELIRQLIRAVRRARPLQAPGIHLAETPDGTRIGLAARNNTPGKSASKGCWRISAETVLEDGASATYHKLEDRYYRIGGRIFESPDQTTLEELVAAGNVWVCAEIRYDSQENTGVAMIRGFGSFAEMETASKARMASLIPLYRLKAKESEDSAPTVHVELDMRTMPNVQEFEWGLE